MKICYFSKDAIQSISDGDEEMREFHFEMIDRRMELNDVIIITDKFYEPIGEFNV